MNIRLLFVFCIVSIGGKSMNGQGNTQFGTLPAMNINTKLDKDWSLNFKWESRQQYEDEFDWVLNDFALVGARKVGLNNKLAAGYQIRFRNNEVIHRSIQQFTIVQRLSGLRLAYRLSTDQTFTPNDPTEWRLRGRITTEIALNGQEVDPGEMYLKINHEYLNSWEGADYDLEVRLIPLLGYVFKDKNKIELGLDYRTRSFLKDIPRNNLWFTFAWYLKL